MKNLELIADDNSRERAKMRGYYEKKRDKIDILAGTSLDRACITGNGKIH